MVDVLILDDIDICQYIGRDEAPDRPRLAILRQLSDFAEVCACDFTACCDVSQPTVSHHLKVLRDAGWIEGDRRGTWIWYSLRPQAVARSHELAGGFGPSRPLPSTRRQDRGRQG